MTDPHRRPAPACPAATGSPRRPRRRGPIAGLAVATAVMAAASGCGGEDDLIGTGPVRSVAPTPDGEAIVLRAWRHRTPNAAVLLDVDPATGRAAPILPKLEGRRGATIRAIELAVPRPETVPVELLIAAPEFGLGVIRGPFVYLGERPVVEPLWPDRLLPPDGGPAAARSPDGGRLLLFRLDEDAASPEATWTATVIDLRSLERTDLSPARGDRDGRWLDADRLVLGGESPRTAADGFAPAPADPGTPEARPDRCWIQGDPPRLMRATAAGPEVVPLPVTPTGVLPWPAATDVPAPDDPPTAAIVWSDDGLLRVGPDAAGDWTADPLPLRFDRTR